MIVINEANITEAYDILLMVLHRINALGEKHSQSNIEERYDGIEKLEVMLLIYNSFVDDPLYLSEGDYDGIYRLEPMC